MLFSLVVNILSQLSVLVVFVILSLWPLTLPCLIAHLTTFLVSLLVSPTLFLVSRPTLLVLLPTLLWFHHQLSFWFHDLLSFPLFSFFLSFFSPYVFFRLASRDGYMGEWEKCGDLTDLDCNSEWFCELPEDQWLNDSESIRKDFVEGIGDKRQEIVSQRKQKRFFIALFQFSFFSRENFK